MKKRALFITVAIVLIISGIGVILHSEFSKNPKPPQQAETTPQQTEQTEQGSRIFDLNSQIVERKNPSHLKNFIRLFNGQKTSITITTRFALNSMLTVKNVP